MMYEKTVWKSLMIQTEVQQTKKRSRSHFNDTNRIRHTKKAVYKEVTIMIQTSRLVTFLFLSYRFC